MRARPLLPRLAGGSSLLTRPLVWYLPWPPLIKAHGRFQGPNSVSPTADLRDRGHCPSLPPAPKPRPRPKSAPGTARGFPPQGRGWQAGGALPPQALASRPSRMVKGLPQMLFLGQDYRTPLSAKVFSSWDFCIQGKGATSIKKHEISNEFKVCASVRCVCKCAECIQCVYTCVRTRGYSRRQQLQM